MSIDNRFDIYDLEKGDIVWVDKLYGWCSVISLSHSINGMINIEFEPTDLTISKRLFTKSYTKRKTFIHL